MANVSFEVAGSAYVGENKKGSYIRIIIDPDKLQRLSSEDLHEKMFLFKSTKGEGQYTLMAPVSLTTIYSR